MKTSYCLQYMRNDKNISLKTEFCQEYISDTQSLVDHRINYSEPQLSLVYQVQSQMAH